MMTHFLYLFIGCFLLTGIVRRIALWRHALAMPSFKHGPLFPVPRGGGYALFLAMLFVFLMLYRYRLIDIAATRALCFSSLIVVFGNLIHDLFPLSVRTRLFIQGASAVAVLTWYNRDLVVLFWTDYLYFTGLWLPLIVFGIMVFINMFNFMDGVDGFAGSQAFIMIFASSVLLALNDETQWSMPLILMCAPILGFLAWNWPPAKIFMGDAGSSFLGVFIATLGLLLATDTSINLWSWLILMGWFIVDSTWSLIVRILHGNDWQVSHRMHAYQILARRWENHFYVTGTLWLVNWLWLFPLAWLAVVNERWGIPLIGIAYLPLCFMCWWLKAGESVNNEPGEPV